MNTAEFEKYFYEKRIDELEKFTTLTKQEIQEV